MSCILGSHKMKDIPKVITLEEPNLEGNISQVEGKYWYISLTHIYCGKQLIIELQNKQYAFKASMQSLKREPTMNVGLIGSQYWSSWCDPYSSNVAYSTTVTCDIILNSIALFTSLKGSIGHQHCKSVETSSYICRAWISSESLLVLNPGNKHDIWCYIKSDHLEIPSQC